MNVFSNMSDTKTIIRFVKEIEKHPCLYDRKSQKYLDRELKRRTWIYIAKKTNSTVAVCKEKWTKIRTAYIRTLRPTYNAGVRTFCRPYYLANHVKFIPYLKRNGACGRENCSFISENKQHEETDVKEKQIEEAVESDESEGNQGGKSQHQVFLNEDDNGFDDDDDDDDKDEDDDDSGDDDDEFAGYDNIVIDRKESNTNEVNKKKVKDAKNVNVHNNHNNEMPCSENIESNPRKMFLFSLLPDIADLNEQQMRSFRRDVIKLIDDVMLNN